MVWISQGILVIGIVSMHERISAQHASSAIMNDQYTCPMYSRSRDEPYKNRRIHNPTVKLPVSYESV